MKIIYVIDILRNKISLYSNVILYGWVKTRRDSHIGITFLNIYDGTSVNVIQVIIHKDIINYKKDILNLTTGCSVKIIGFLIKSKGNKQLYDIKAIIVKVLGKVLNSNKYPITTKYHNLEYLRTIQHLRPRTNLFSVIGRIRNNLYQNIHIFMNKNRFIWINTPILTTYDTEGGSDLFKINNYGKTKFFNKNTYLTVSGQLNGESFACALYKIYTFGPIFRAEKSNTTKHLAEFWMLEPEVAFSKLKDIIYLSENMLKYVINKILNICYLDLIYLSNNKNKLIYKLEFFLKQKIIKIEYKNILNILFKNVCMLKTPIYWGMDFNSDIEKFLLEKYFKRPIIIINYPKNIKAFYMRLNKDNKTVASMDIFLPGIGEIIGGSEREERLSYLDNSLNKLGLNIKKYFWYRDLRKYGTIPHSGFGLGFERLIMYITNIKNIRDISPFPRSQGNIKY